MSRFTALIGVKLNQGTVEVLFSPNNTVLKFPVVLNRRKFSEYSLYTTLKGFGIGLYIHVCAMKEPDYVMSLMSTNEPAR